MSSQDNDDVVELPADVSDNLADEDAPLTTSATSRNLVTLTSLEPVSRSQPTIVDGGEPSVLLTTTTAIGELTTSTTSVSASSDSLSSRSYLPIPLTAPPGSVVITQPVSSPGADPALYKIARGSPVTFGWKFSDVIATPTHLTIAAIAGGRTYAVGGTRALPDNLIFGSAAGEPGVVDGTATQIVWDLDAYQNANPNAPLLQTMYTLSIWDDRGPQPTFRPGYLLPNAQLKFSLYTPQAYQSLDDGTLFSLSGFSPLFVFFRPNAMLEHTLSIDRTPSFHDCAYISTFQANMLAFIIIRLHFFVHVLFSCTFHAHIRAVQRKYPIVATYKMGVHQLQQCNLVVTILIVFLSGFHLLRGTPARV
ncbi:hypothetical protein D9619_009570 [Psilocybe cf. subviscida]|uniref:DUF7137 domain-containing protein n=1 Tax=Psilocybe cf. subviscida TaxID=2480587 RepID=A0A8H5F630_9AGAR|nr:hypothetical protein D9619_009570 [Psilocybe cf. subviscida]